MRRLLGGFAGFAAATVAIIALSALILTQVFEGPGDRPAIRASAFVAIVIQLTAFRAARLLVSRNLLAAIALGAGMRLIGLVVFALLAQTTLGLPLPASLISLVVFYLLSTLMEPLFLRS
jgi:hypothetical protein